MLSMEVMTFLSNWLKNHIVKTDKQYSAYFIEHGVKLA
jgi:hemerythrin